jgi:fructokinase
MLSEDAFQRTSLCVVGNINRDIKTEPFSSGEYLFNDGETSVASVRETVGGGGANSAFTAARLGANTTFIGKVGTDGLGKRLEGTLAAAGITSLLRKDPNHPSGTSVALTFTSGHRHFISCLPVNRALTIQDISLERITSHKHLLRADIWFSENMLFEGNGVLFHAARKANVRTSIDLNWDPAWGKESSHVIRDRKKAAREVLPLVDLAHGNVRELCEFSDASDLDTALRRLADWGVGAVVVHLGSKGSGYYHQGRLEIEAAVPAQKQVNVTGTGDVLSVCMMLLDGLSAPVTERLRLANRIVAEFIEGRRSFIPDLCD